jgi:hypothetical protein
MKFGIAVLHEICRGNTSCVNIFFVEAVLYVGLNNILPNLPCFMTYVSEIRYESLHVMLSIIFEFHENRCH